MWKIILSTVGAISIGTAAYIGLAPHHWYAHVPGVDGTGPLNLHFARDVAMAFFASGGALLWAGVKTDVSAAFCGAAWLVMHALFHIWIWLHRGAPADLIALTNLVGLQLPAFAALIAAVQMKNRRVRA